MEDTETSPSSGENRTATARGFARLLAAYRGRLPRAEAARRAGVSEKRWTEVETGSIRMAAGAAEPAVPAHTVAAMCVAVGADVATGLQLAGYDPGEYDYLLDAPPSLMHVKPTLSPHIALYREIADIATSPTAATRSLAASMYRDVAALNRQLAERILREPPDERSEYWAGYASALQAIADEQAQMADEESHPVR